MYFSFLYQPLLDTTFDLEAEQLRCPSNYQQVAVELIKMKNSTSKECAKECYKNRNCKAFTVLNPESEDPTIDFQQDIVCIMTAITVNDASEMKNRFGETDKDRRAIMCVKKISKLDWNQIFFHNI